MSQTRRVNNVNLLEENSLISLCRICLEDGARIPIFEIDDEENYDTLTKLSLCLKEKIEDINGYPRFICNICSDILDSAYKFINKYKDTCKILQNSIDIVKQETGVPIENVLAEEETETHNIKTEIQDYRSDNSNDGFSDEDKEFLVPLKVKLKEENGKKAVRNARNYTSTNTKQVTSKIASSILEGQFTWDGDKWCLQSDALKLAKQKLKLLTEIKAEPVKKKRVTIEVPKVKLRHPAPEKLCDLCGEIFKDQAKLWLHKKKVHHKRAKQCPHCGKMVASQYYLNRHIKRKHSNSKDFICATCGRSFAFKGELRSHTRVVHEKLLQPKKQYKCKICSKIYKCPKSVVVHERSVHTGQRPAACSICDSRFYHDDYLKEHMRLHTGETPFKCPVCGRGYAQRCNMKSHLRIHRVSELDPITLSKLRPNYLRLHKKKVHHKRAKQCPHCGKMVASQYYLNRHIKRKHSNSKDFICATCGRSFAFKGELRSHTRVVHEKLLQPKKQYKCKICSKIYKCPKSVVVHERSVHTGQRPAACSICDSRFYHDDYLKEHMRLHTGETPFKCPVCGRGYAQRCNMKSHLRIHRVSELDPITLSKLRPNYLRLLKA